MLDIAHGDFDFCRVMKCPKLIQPPDCDPATCKSLDDERKRRGAIYLVSADGESAGFVGMLTNRRWARDSA